MNVSLSPSATYGVSRINYYYRRIVDSAALGYLGSVPVLLSILLAAGFCSVLHAVAKPFWYDEICTVILCRLPNASEIWKALDHAADSNPPIFYLVAHWTRQLISDDHLGYRLPSIVGLLVAVSSVYVILSRRVDRLAAMVGAAFLLHTQLAAFAYEARPYALMLACISVAILAWQRIDESRLYSLAVACALAAAVSMHYYAILVWPAFLIAEASVWIFRRRFRKSAWAAFVVGGLPLLFFAPLLLKFRQYYGQNFWARPSIGQAFGAYGWLFALGGHRGLIFALGITALFLYLSITRTTGIGSYGRRPAALLALPVDERILTLMFLSLPLIAFAVATVGHGGMTERYMFPTILGGALALGYVAAALPSAARVLLLVFLLMHYASSSVDVVRRFQKGALFASRASAANELHAIASQYDRPGLPIVISDAHRYLPMAYYTPAESSGNLYSVEDPDAALTYSAVRSDSTDLSLLMLRRYFPLQVEDYTAFVSKHKEFLLLSEGSNYEWLAARLAHEGYSLSTVSDGREGKLSRVSLP